MPAKRRCVACRTSQRSCDTRRPKCSRCIARSVECVYPETPKFSFVDQNSFSAELSRRAASRSTRCAPTMSLEVFVPDGGSHAQEGWEQPPHAPALLPQPLWSLDERVLRRFFILWTGGYTCLGSFDFISKVYTGSSEASATKSAVLAVAYADLALLECHGDYVNKSYEAYLSTLRGIQGHLRDSPAADVATDNILTSILVIDSYELLYMRRPAPLGSHTSAIVRFLQLRRKEGRYDPRCVEMWRAAYPRLQARQLLCGLPSFDKSIGYLEMLGDNALDRCVATFVSEACDGMYSLKGMLDRVIKEQATVADLIQHSSELYRLLQETAHTLEHDTSLPNMREIAVPLPLHPYWPDCFVRSRILVSERFWIARDWILFHMCRIKILDLLLDVEDHCLRHYAAVSSWTLPHWALDKQLALSRLNESCQILLDIMPFLMGLTNNHGQKTHAHFRDTGLLIAHYPLWTIKQSKNVWYETRQDVEVLLRFFETYRSIAGRSP